MSKILQINPLSAENARAPEPSLPTKVIAITSGKGGVGKTNITSNLGIALASRGARVCIFDADTSLANINVLMGLNPAYTLEHLLRGEKAIDEIILDGPKGVKIIPAASGIASYCTLNAQQRQKLLDMLAELEARFDYLLIDTAAGIGDTVLSFVRSAQYTILVISPEPTSLTDAFALLRVLKRSGLEQPIYVLVNMVQNYANSIEVFKRFETAAGKYLQSKVHYLGYIPEDSKIKQSVSIRTPVILHAPSSLASRCFVTLAEVLNKQLSTPVADHRFSDYWESQLSNSPPAGKATMDTHEGSLQEFGQPDFATLGRQLLKSFEDKQASQDQTRELIGSLCERYQQHFLEPPLDDAVLLKFFAERPALPEANFRDLIFSLEALYERRYDHPVRGINNRIMKLISDIEGSKDLCAELIQQLSNNFGPQIHQVLLASPDEFIAAINEIEPDKEALDALLKKLAQIYQSRFGAPPPTLTNEAIGELKALVQRLDHQESQLEDSLIRMGHFIDDNLDEPAHDASAHEDKH